MECVFSPIMVIPLLNFKLILAFLILGSIANTVTGKVTFSPGLNFLGSEDNTINGLRTGVVSSILP